MSLVLISSDLSIIAEMVDNVAVMYAGKIVEKGSSDNIYLEPAHPYTEGLLRSIPRLKKTEQIQWIQGLPPDLINPPLGCRFHPRCQQAMDICRKQEPTEKCLGREHFVSCWLYPA
jgi:peptide/nickel transport system ATP-binding protein